MLSRRVGVGGQPREAAPLGPEHRSDGLWPPVNPAPQIVLDARLELLVELAEAPDGGHGHEVAAPETADLTLDPAFLMRPLNARRRELRLEEVVRPQRDEAVRLLAPLPTQNLFTAALRLS